MPFFYFSFADGANAVFYFFNSTLPQIKIIQRDDDEGVAGFFVGDEFRDFRDGHEVRDQIFAAVEFHAVLQAAVFNQHGAGDVAQDRGIGMAASTF